MDLSKLSDQELEEIANSKAPPKGTQALSTRPSEAKANQITAMSNFSDEELESIAGVEKPTMGTLPAVGKTLLKGFDLPGAGPYLAGAGQALGEGLGIATSGGGLVNAVRNIPEAFGRGRRAEVEERKLASESLGAADIPVQIAGGLLSGGVGAARAVGKTALSTIGKSAAIGAGTGFTQGLGETGTLKGGLESGAIGAGVGAAGGLLAGGLQKYLGSQQKGLKANVGNIRQAAKNLGAPEPVPGMISADPDVQKLQSTIAQQPTLVSKRVSEPIVETYERLEAGAKNLLAPKTINKTGFESAADTAQEIAESLGQRKAAVSAPFEKIAEETRNIAINPKRLERAANDISKMKTFYQGGEGTLNFYSNALKKSVGNLDELKILRETVGNAASEAYQNGRFNDYNLYKAIKGRINSVEQRQILESSIKLAKEGFGKRGEKIGRQIAKEVLGDISQARKNYTVYKDDVRKLSKILGIREKLPYDLFVKELQLKAPTALGPQLFMSKNPRKLLEIKKQFPEAFETARKAHLAEIFKQLEKDDMIPVGSFVNKLKQYPDESLKALFGEKGVRQFKDIKTLYQAFGDKMGPSGTPQGMAWMEFVQTFGTSALKMLPELSKAVKLQASVRGQEMGRKAARGLLTPVMAGQAVTDNE